MNVFKTVVQEEEKHSHTYNKSVNINTTQF